MSRLLTAQQRSAASAPLARFTGTARFRPLACLGRGSMGVVYRVYDEETTSEVALKTLGTRAPDTLYQLKQEFRSLTDIVHPNLVELYELVVDQQECFFTMELVDGVSFVDYVRPGAALDLDRLVDATQQLTVGLSLVHAADKLHRDVKPANILVTPAGRVVLLDFGLATALRRDDALGADTGVAGTLAYMAPESVCGTPPSPAADWYSVGVVLYEAVTGRLPFQGPPARLLRDKIAAHLPAPRTVAPGIPAWLDTLTVALLEPDPARRAHAPEILEQMEAAAGENLVEDGAVPVSATPQRTLQRNVPASDHAVFGGEHVLFVGRTREIAKLHAVFDQVQHGQAAVVHVFGPSGIGKSELLRRFLSSIETNGQALVLRGRCHPQETVPYKALDPLVDALSRVLVSLPNSLAHTLAPRQAAALLRLFPVLGRVPALVQPDPDADAAEPHEIRRRGAAAFRALLATLAAPQPLILCIDDVQWGDLDSAALLREVLRPPDAPALLLLLSYRDEDRDRIPVLEALGSYSGELPPGSTHELPIGALDVRETMELARLLCARLDTPQSVAAVADESEGSPFFLSQLARHVSATARVGSGGAEAAPVRLTEVLNDRVRRLSSAARQVLEIVAVAGRPLDRNVALSAAGIGQPGRPVVVRLERESFLRSTTLGDQTAVEVYHDRIRETMVGLLGADDIRHRHRDIAEALQQFPDPDPQELFSHYLGAGAPSAARQHGLAAADRAARALAFDRAAQLYRQVLELQDDGPDHASIVGKLAEALANCGRGVEAARIFEAAARELAAETPSSEQMLTLQRRAAEQYLRAGHLEQGVRLMRTVLAAVGVAFPDTGRRALAAALGQRARLLWRGMRFTGRRAADIPPQALLRLTACWGAALSLSVVDQMTAEALGVRHLVEALDVGERSHIARALGWEATKGAALGGKFMRRRCARLLRIMEQIAQETGDPYDRAWCYIASGTSAYELANWRKTLQDCDTGVNILREHCTGVTWEIVTFGAFALSALAHMGELRTLAQRLPAAIGDADERGDLYAGIGLRAGVLNLVWLAQDRPGYARQQADDAMARWPASASFHIQHYLHLIAAVQADLYVRDGWRAWTRIVDAWPKLRRTAFLRLEGTRVELLNLRARAALAAATSHADGQHARASARDPRWSRTRLLRIASNEAAHIEKASLASARPLATLLRAGVADVEGRAADAIQLLGHAAEGFANADMRLYAAAARRRRGTHCAGDEGQRLQAESDSWMRDQGIQHPAAMAAVYCPTNSS